VCLCGGSSGAMRRLWRAMTELSVQQAVKGFCSLGGRFAGLFLHVFDWSLICHRPVIAGVDEQTSRKRVAQFHPIPARHLGPGR